jgi:hypothetical protein
MDAILLVKIGSAHAHFRVDFSIRGMKILLVREPSGVLHRRFLQLDLADDESAGLLTAAVRFHYNHELTSSPSSTFRGSSGHCILGY